MAIHPSRLRSEIAKLEQTFEPGEHIVAETFGQAGRVPWWEVPATYAAYAVAAFGVVAGTVAFFLGNHGAAGLLSLCAAPTQVAWYTAGRRKSACIVVTTRFVYLLQLPGNRRGRTQFMQTPTGCVRVASDRAGRLRRVIRLEGPDLPIKGLQFLVTGPWRAEVDSVIAALRADSAVSAVSAGSAVSEGTAGTDGVCPAPVA